MSDKSQTTPADVAKAHTVCKHLANDQRLFPHSFEAVPMGAHSVGIIAQALANARTESAMQQISDIGQLQTALEERDAARKDAQDLADALEDFIAQVRQQYCPTPRVSFNWADTALTAHEQRRKKKP